MKLRHRQQRTTKTPWADSAKRRAAIDKLAQQLNIKSFEDWYKVTGRDIDLHGGASLFRYYRRSVPNLVMDNYPEHSWKPWLFHTVPKRWWDDIDHRRAFFKSLCEDMNWSDLSSLYELTSQTIMQHGGGGLLKLYKFSPMLAVMSAFPEHPWEVWKFKNKRMRWKDIDSQRAFLESIKSKLGITCFEDWYNVRQADLIECGGFSLVVRYKGSHAAMLMTIYPEHTWLPWKFGNCPLGWWRKKENQRRYLEWFAKEMGIQNMEDWYHVTLDDFRARKGTQLAQMYGSPHKIMKEFFPSHKWEQWKFTRAPKGFWKDLATTADAEKASDELRRFLEEIAGNANITRLEQWYNIPLQQNVKPSQEKILALFGGLPAALQKAFPDHIWDVTKFKRLGWQAYLIDNINALFPNTTVLVMKDRPD